MKVGKKSRHGRFKSRPQPHKGNHRYTPSPAARQKKADYRRRKRQLAAPEGEF
jgi:hypothetical protein